MLVLIGCSIDLRLVLTAKSFLHRCFQANYFWSGFNPFKKNPFLFIAVKFVIINDCFWRYVEVVDKLFLWLFFFFHMSEVKACTNFFHQPQLHQSKILTTFNLLFLPLMTQKKYPTIQYIFHFPIFLLNHSSHQKKMSRSSLVCFI